MQFFVSDGKLSTAQRETFTTTRLAEVKAPIHKEGKVHS